MAFTASIDKTRKDLEKTLSNSTPLLAVVGAGDLAVHKLRAAGAELNARASQLDPATVRSQTEATVGAVQAEVLATPDRVKTLPAKAQSALEDVSAGALSAYGDLAERGKILVNRISGQQATKDLQDQAKSTASKAKATATTAKKSASRTKSATKAATTTAKKQAKATKTSAKGTTTSATKTASAATKAAGDAAAKVGD